jgi:hypothetical protein
VVKFGYEVASLVEQLTDRSRLKDGNRAARKAIDREHLATATPPAKTIKLADLIDNALSIVAGDAHFSSVYLGEMAQLLNILREGDSTLWAMAHKILLDHGNGISLPNQA